MSKTNSSALAGITHSAAKRSASIFCDPTSVFSRRFGFKCRPLDPDKCFDQAPLPLIRMPAYRRDERRPTASEKAPPRFPRKRARHITPKLASVSVWPLLNNAITSRGIDLGDDAGPCGMTRHDGGSMPQTKKVSKTYLSAPISRARRLRTLASWARLRPPRPRRTRAQKWRRGWRARKPFIWTKPADAILTTLDRLPVSSV